MTRASSLFRTFLFLISFFVGAHSPLFAQINTDRALLMGRNALYYEDYVLAIQRFNMVINAKPWMAEPYFLRALAKFYLEDNQGAESDCVHALDLNPYVANYYLLRAQCRINQGHYGKAVDDYRKALEINPLDKNSWHDMAVCQIEEKQYAAADSTLDHMIATWPKDVQPYSMKAQVAFCRKDSVIAESWIDRALEINAYEGSAWAMKSMMQAQREEYAQAEASLDKAILQMPRNADMYINRAMVRFHQDNLRGAMDDYDTAVEMEPNNYYGHYNRGLLRAQVGEDNLAIEDFDFVLKLEPDNTIALYNRALLYENIGNLDGAIRDLSKVIDDYPEFWEGYRRRASVRRKIGDVYGAERDEFKILKAQMASATGHYKSSGKTRKKSEHNIEDYNKLVEEDEHTTENEYASDYRGKVQNRKTELQPEPIYLLTYAPKSTEVNNYVAYSRELDLMNARQILPHKLSLSGQEEKLDETSIDKYTAHIASLSGRDTLDASGLLARALDYYHIRDFENCMADLNVLISREPKQLMAYVLRGQCRYSQLCVMEHDGDSKEARLGYLMVLQDYTRAAELDEESPYLYYNKGVLYQLLGEWDNAVQSYSRALELDDRFPAAYYNRGVTYLMMKNKAAGLNDLSQAGEYGLYTAYSLIKKYSNEIK